MNQDHADHHADHGDLDRLLGLVDAPLELDEDAQAFKRTLRLELGDTLHRRHRETSEHNAVPLERSTSNPRSRRRYGQAAAAAAVVIVVSGLVLLLPRVDPASRLDGTTARPDAEPQVLEGPAACDRFRQSPGIERLFAATTSRPSEVELKAILVAIDVLIVDVDASTDDTGPDSGPAFADDLRLIRGATSEAQLLVRAGNAAAAANAFDVARVMARELAAPRPFTACFR